mgnify:CR=1 FL=1
MCIRDRYRGLPPSSPGERLLIDRVIEDGEEIQVGKERLRAIYTLGHSPCSLSLYLNEEVLLVSDSLGGWFHLGRGGLHPSYFYDLGEFLKTRERLSEIPCDILCLGHNGYLKGEGRIRKFYQDMYEALSSFIDDVDKRLRSADDLDRLSRSWAKGWHRGFLRFFPLGFHVEGARLIIRRTLEYLGKDDLIRELFPS